MSSTPDATATSATARERQAHVVGAGIAGLAAAAYLVRDGGLPGSHIHVYEQLQVPGGSLDGAGDAVHGYIIRGGREMEAHFECTWDLFGAIPALGDPRRSVLDEIRDFNRLHRTRSNCRLVAGAQKADFSSLGLSFEHVLALARLTLTPERELAYVRIQDFFPPTMFATNFWTFWRTMFAFQAWHGVSQMKRYLIRFMHLLPGMPRLEGILRTPYNQFDSLIRPLTRWLQQQGVHFHLATQVDDLEIVGPSTSRRVSSLRIVHDGRAREEAIAPHDVVLVTNGSMTENSSLGSMTAPAILDRDKGAAWRLWETLSARHADFGKPHVFAACIDETKWLSFTTTFQDSFFFNKVRDFTGNEHGTGGLVTFTDSNWLMSIVLSYQPHFINQPSQVHVMWGYGLLPDTIGNFVRKPMSDCTGAELLVELCHHLGFGADAARIASSARVIPCMMPYITSQLQPCGAGDRPAVVPQGVTNLAFIGQFAEVAGDCVFTIEYSIRTAITAVYRLLAIGKEVPPVYPAHRDVGVITAAAATLLGPHRTSLKMGLRELLS